ncbi:MAG: UDP-3-O-(3-hydroxymyristoyl)glucosamine N-acyltransferase [Bacteroidales bacterium]|nr:UDP-3-O-(3-hydroxymyristoyl)glucosamine N-acyltransferase [Bacteroidales bacterium]MDD3431342.1 UDP-3-O-(3-hydroxymyristoyl)glucosamine N-acyltransferase [Bacteroidales bacterium]MDD4361785.1 UDP-3-O-(3-hydroxymyristoyl)glucosamine N-acyltransferase [Bacteroidales bacterium]MDD4430091.1 UDP-3-O-(3-hydroxymyristoyl)glucosamine N-acyltransferase [Bacteroidales bacterium]
MDFTASQIASFLSGTVEGDPNVLINTFSKIEEGSQGALTFLSNEKYTSYLYTTGASAVLVSKDFKPEQAVKATLIRVENPYEALARLLQWSEQFKEKFQGIDKDSFIDSTAVLGTDVYVGHFSCVCAQAQIGDESKIYPQVYLGRRVRVGKNCILYPGVKVFDDCVIGDNCILQAGVVIGGDGFGFAPQKDGSYTKIPQIGNVVIENDVEICANTTIDRATMGSTIIRRGVKLDNLIMVAHNVEIGEDTVIAAQTGIAGSSKIGSNCMFGGQVGITGHISIPDGTVISAQAGIISSVKTNEHPLLGSPALPSKEYLRSYTLFRKLPELVSELKATRKELEALKQKLNNNA